MHAAVVKLNTLTDPVGTAAQDHDLRFFVRNRVFVGCIISGIVICAVLGTAYVNTFPGLFHSQADPFIADLFLRDLQQLSQILVRKSVLLGPDQSCILRKAALERFKSFFLLYQLEHLSQEIGLNMGQVMDLFHRSSLPERFINDKVPVAGGRDQFLQQFFPVQIAVTGTAKAVSPGLQTADGFLEGFFKVLSNAHDLADCPHLGTQLILYTFEFFKSPACKLDDHIIPVRNIFVQRSVFAAGNVRKPEAGRQHGGNESDGEAGGLAGQCRGSGGPGIDLDDDIAIADRIMSPLYIGPADDLDGFNDLVGFFLQTFLHLFRYGQHGSRTERISCVHAHRIDVFDKADRDHVVVCIPDDFQLQLFPAKDGLLYQDLSHQGRLKTPCTDLFQLFHVVYQAASGAAHGICGTQDYRIAQLVGDGQCFINGIGDFAPGHFDPEALHGMLEFDPVFTAFDRIYLDADDLYIVLFQYTFFGKLRTKIKTRLSSEIGKKSVWSFFRNDLLHAFRIQRFNISNVSNFRIRHDRRRIGIDKYDFIAEISERFARLGAGIVKLTGLTDDDRARTDDQDFMNVCSLRHSNVLRSVFFQSAFFFYVTLYKKLVQSTIMYFAQVFEQFSFSSSRFF